jgi:hypothetical protein
MACTVSVWRLVLYADLRTFAVDRHVRPRNADDDLAFDHGFALDLDGFGHVGRGLQVAGRVDLGIETLGRRHRLLVAPIVLRERLKAAGLLDVLHDPLATLVRAILDHGPDALEIGLDARALLIQKEDLVPLCPNCHAVAHRRNPPFSVDEIRDLLQPGTGDPSRVSETG